MSESNNNKTPSGDKKEMSDGAAAVFGCGCFFLIAALVVPCIILLWKFVLSQ